MKRIILLLVAVATLAGGVAFTATASRHADQEAAPIFVTEIPAGYRDWKVVSVAHEEGDLNEAMSLKILREAMLRDADQRDETQVADNWLEANAEGLFGKSIIKVGKLAGDTGAAILFATAGVGALIVTSITSYSASTA